jgi:hypothetical protein
VRRECEKLLRVKAIPFLPIDAQGAVMKGLAIGAEEGRTEIIGTRNDERPQRYRNYVA